MTVLFRIGDVDVTNVGRRSRGSKKRIRFRYALKHSGGGGDGNGMKHRDTFEHEVVLLWSFHSGKAVIQHDGVEIKSDRKPHPSVVDITYNDGLSGGEKAQGRTFRVVCCRTKPINSPETFRKYELVVDGKPLIDYPNLPGHDDEATEGTFAPPPSYSSPPAGEGILMSILEVLFPDGNYGCKERTQDELSTSYRAEEDTLQYSDDDGSAGDLESAPSADLIDFGSADDNDGAPAPGAGAGAATTASEDGAIVPPPQNTLAPAPGGGDMLGTFDALTVGGDGGAVAPQPEGTGAASATAALVPSENGNGGDLFSAFGAVGPPPPSAPGTGVIVRSENGAGPVVAVPAAADPFGVFGAAAPPPAAIVPHPEGTPATANYGAGDVPTVAPGPAQPIPAAVPPAPANDDPFSIFGAIPAPSASPADPFA